MKRKTRYGFNKNILRLLKLYKNATLFIQNGYNVIGFGCTAYVGNHVYIFETEEEAFRAHVQFEAKPPHKNKISAFWFTEDSCRERLGNNFKILRF